MPAPASPGMSGGQMAALGGVAMLGGGLLDYVGQTQGARALEREAKRQAAEQAAMLEARHAAYVRALGRADPAQRGAVSGGQALLRVNASTPVIAAGGRALGLGSGQTANVGRSLLPSQIIGAQRASGDIVQDRTQENVGRLNNEQGDLDAAMQGASALYPMRDEIAKSAGSGLRLGGQLLSSAGMPLLVAGMNQAAEVPADEMRWGRYEGGADPGGGGFTQVPGVSGQPGPWSNAQPAPVRAPYLPSGALYPLRPRR